VTRGRGSCARCGAILASDQEYCLECGDRRLRPARSPWIAPVVAALVVIAASAALFAVWARDLRSDADREARAPVAKEQKETPKGKKSQSGGKANARGQSGGGEQTKTATTGSSSD
jgi:DNA-directed RNA polymerase subunit RPC12/RpoP